MGAGPGGDVFARRLGGGGSRTWRFARAGRPPQSSLACAVVVARFARRRNRFCHQFFISSRSVTCGVWNIRRAAAPSILTCGSNLWMAAERMWRDHFWWGVGPAHYDYRFREYRPVNVQMRPDRAHNDYLNLLADWGTAGGRSSCWRARSSFALAGLARTWRVSAVRR